jgi:hypothetical protein
VVWLVAVAGLSFLSAIFWSVFGPDVAGVSSARADSFSRSALGHHAFVRLLRALDVPVFVSRFDSGGRAGRGALLVLLEPRLTGSALRDADALLRTVSGPGRALVVLPKWHGTEDPERPGWIAQAALLPEEVAAAVLDAFNLDGEIVRPAAPPTNWRTELTRVGPDLPYPQLLSAQRLRGLVTCDQGILFGYVNMYWGTLYVLADPDLFSNHGLGRGANAALTLRILEVARSRRETVVVDETFHGHLQEPSVFRALFDFPLVLATLQALLTMGVLLWAAMGRFGAPAPFRPALEPGKEFLIGNIASLLRFGGQSVHVLQRYLRGAQAEVGRRLHLPARLSATDAREWLRQVGAQRRVSVRLEKLEEEVGKATRRRRNERVLPIAERIYRWREEMIHGPGSRT